MTGVDRLFLAPETNELRCSPKCDIWSIGAIIYLLITGGTTEKRHEEDWSFKESVWFSTSEEIKAFLMMALEIFPQDRASADELLASDFM